MKKNLFFEKVPAEYRADNQVETDKPLDAGDPLFKERKRPAPFGLAVLFTSLKLFLFAFVVVCFIGLGLFLGVAKAYVETTPTLDIAQLTISDRTSYLYDMNGNLMTSLADVEYRDWVDIENIPDMLKNAFISVEDVRFFKHSGVDFKRLFSAALEILGNSNSSGGSTITQQLIKNKVLGAQRNYKRKIQEAYLALELEKRISKDQILEAYLNDIHLGESNYGVKTTAMDYFGKELSQLSIRECAMMAGLTQQPYKYNPRKNMYQRKQMDVTNARTDQVLGRMYQAGYINSEQYHAALNETVAITEVSQQKQMYDMAYFVEYVTKDVVTHLLKQRGLSDTTVNRNAVENELRTGGYKIYTTVDPKIQNAVQTELSTWEKYPTLADSSKALVVETNSDGSVVSETVQPQAAAVVMDYRTGELRAIVGGRDEPTIRKGINRASQSYTEVGSSIKPLSIYGPALDLGISPATIVPNMDGVIEGWGTKKGYPGGGLNSRYGPVTVRRGLMSSMNVVAARVLMQYVTPAISANYLYQLGATENKINVDGPGLALGTSGITPVQLTAGYGAIANGGTYLEPLSFTKVFDIDGNVLLDADAVRDTHRVFQESTAFLLVDMMQDAVKSGTGTRAKISDMTVAGKTGTNSDYASVYFAGMTPYYVSSVFIGHDYPVNKLKEGASGGDYAAPLWQAYMAKIHEGLEDKAIIDADPTSLGLVKRTVCTVSGLLATDACKEDNDHKPVTDWFVASKAPTAYCDMHLSMSVCTASNALATQFCPAESVQPTNYILIRPASEFYAFEDQYLLKAMPNAVRTELSTDEFATSMPTCTVHADGSLNIFALKTNAEDLIQKVQDYLGATIDLDASLSANLKDGVAALAVSLSGYEYSAIEPAYNKLKMDYERISTEHPRP
ncbi:MAG: transglycosylase domain-containing protein [Clostridia bacterium]